MIACIDNHCDEARSSYEAIPSRKLKAESRKPIHRWLVTGGAGFIGSHIVERLLKDGHFVRVLDNFSSGKESNLDFTRYAIRDTQYELIRGDIRDYDTCITACHGVDYVLHQAALRSVPKSMNRPHEYNEVNIDGTVNMLRAAREKGVKRFVLASSSSVYGEVKSFPQKETDPSYLISPYALTKLAGEYYCRIFSKNYGLETVSLRYFNVFGPRQALDDEYAVVIPKFITCMLNNEQPPIYGNGMQSRDFTYIDNVVEANILAATTSARDTQYAIRDTSTFCEVFNVAAGKDHSILDLVDILNRMTDKDIMPKFTSPRPGDVKRTCADITKIKNLLNFQPNVNFQPGLRKTADWFEMKKLMVCV